MLVGRARLAMPTQTMYFFLLLLWVIFSHIYKSMLTIPLTFLFVIAIFLASALSIFFIVQKYLSFWTIDDTAHATIFSFAIGTIFGLTLAFITVSTWQNYNRINSIVVQEATTLTTIYRSLDAFQPTIKDPSVKLLKSYIDKVISKEWPLMAKGQFDDQYFADFHQFQLIMLRHNPLNNAELIAQQEELRLISEYYKFRLQRITSSKATLDYAMTITLCLGAFVFIFYHSLYVISKRRHHVLMISLLAITLGLIFFLILSYNTPFSGPNAIGPDEFYRVLELWKTDSLKSP